MPEWRELDSKAHSFGATLRRRHSAGAKDAIQVSSRPPTPNFTITQVKLIMVKRVMVKSTMVKIRPAPLCSFRSSGFAFGVHALARFAPCGTLKGGHQTLRTR